MTLRTLSMPRLGETMEEGTIAAWLIQPGQAFKRGQPLLEVETDKTVVEYPALGDGVLEETLVAPGDVVAVGAPIAKVSADQWEDAGADTAEVETPAVAAVSTKPAQTPVLRQAGQPLRATPVARRMAREAGIALETLAGSGRRGRIEARDVQGAGAVDTVLLLHGFAGDGGTWAALTAALSRAGKTVIAPDLPGHGADEGTPQGIDDLLAAVTARVAGAGRLHVVGHSLGGHVATLFAAAEPDRVASLTLIAPAGLGREIDHPFVQGMARAATAGEVAHLFRSLGPKAMTLSPDAQKMMAETLAKGRLIPLAEALAGPQGQKVDTLGPLSRLPDRIPVRVLVGTEDRIIPPAHIFNLPPRVAVHVLPTGHMPQWDAPADVAAIIMGAMRHV